MGSRSSKIYLLFWLGLAGLTCLAAFLVPRILDSSNQQGYREIDGQGRPVLVEPLTASVDTRFPTRPFHDDELAPDQPERQAFPTGERTPAAAEDPSGEPTGLPQRDVSPSSGNPPPADVPVTSRARVVQDSSVYESPRTTARVLGTVSPGTQVSWARTIEPGWEEIILRDGRSVYMQSTSLQLPGGSLREPEPGTDQPVGREVEGVSQLPPTVDSFLSVLRDGDVLRAGTYLAPGSPPLEEPDLGVWASLVGPQADGRVGRVEPVPGRGAEARSVLIVDQAGSTPIMTVWEYDSSTQRWLLSSWE